MFSRFGRAGSPWPTPRDCRRAGSCCFSIPVRGPAPSTPLRSHPPRRRFTRCSRSPSLPFGWRGLVALNTLAYLATIVMVFLYTRRYATEASTPWMAAAAFALGGFVIEYAQGVWPHALSIALCTGGILAAGRVSTPGSWDSSENGRPSLAAAAGFLLGLATGVRYQNAVILAVVAGGIALWSAQRRSEGR